MKIQKERGALLILCFWVLTGLQQSNAESFRFCHFGPEARVIGGRPKKEGCIDRVKVQALQWKCCESGDVGPNTRTFFKTLKEKAKETCEEYCESRGSGCHGRFIGKHDCGFSVDRNFSEAVGEKFGCSDRCEGKSISYCSIYHAGYMKTTQGQLEGKSPNCICSGP